MGLDNPIHIAFIVLILLLVFGAKRLPELGRSLGTGMREFKQSVTGETHAAEKPQQPMLAPASPQAPAETPVAPPAPAAAPPPAAVAQPVPAAPPAEAVPAEHQQQS